MMGLFLACLMGICGLPDAPARAAAVSMSVASQPAPPPPDTDTNAAPLAERPVAARPDAAPTATAAPIDKLSRADITAVVEKQTWGIKRCYEAGLVEDGSYTGTVEIGWKIQTDGRVTTAKVLDATTRNATTEGCLVSEILGWRFPEASEPTAVGVYPFVLDARLLARHPARPPQAERPRTAAAP